MKTQTLHLPRVLVIPEQIKGGNHRQLIEYFMGVRCTQIGDVNMYFLILSTCT